MKPGALSLRPSYRTKLEEKIGSQLEEAGISFVFEGDKVPFLVPERKAKYLPDFQIGNIIIEAKGYMYRSAQERQKFILLKAQHPELDIRFVFSDAAKPIYKGSSTTYGEWAAAHGFKWNTRGIVPITWLKDLKEESKKHEHAKHRK